MALIVEDGSIVPDAESYVTVAELRNYAGKRGVELPADDVECEVLLIKAMDFLGTYDARWKGQRTDATQALAWPRKGVTLNGAAWPSDAIPGALKAGQCSLAIVAQTMDLMPSINRSEANLKRRKVGGLEREWFDRGEVTGNAALPLITAVESLLAPLLVPFRLTIDRA